MARITSRSGDFCSGETRATLRLFDARNWACTDIQRPGPGSPTPCLTRRSSLIARLPSGDIVVLSGLPRRLPLTCIWPLDSCFARRLVSVPGRRQQPSAGLEQKHFTKQNDHDSPPCLAVKLTDVDALPLPHPRLLLVRSAFPWAATVPSRYSRRGLVCWPSKRSGRKYCRCNWYDSVVAAFCLCRCTGLSTEGALHWLWPQAPQTSWKAELERQGARLWIRLSRKCSCACASIRGASTWELRVGFL